MENDVKKSDILNKFSKIMPLAQNHLVIGLFYRFVHIGFITSLLSLYALFSIVKSKKVFNYSVEYNNIIFVIYLIFILFWLIYANFLIFKLTKKEISVITYLVTKIVGGFLSFILLLVRGLPDFFNRLEYGWYIFLCSIIFLPLWEFLPIIKKMSYLVTIIRIILIIILLNLKI